jgi:hypothetical protein
MTTLTNGLGRNEFTGAVRSGLAALNRRNCPLEQNNLTVLFPRDISTFYLSRTVRCFIRTVGILLGGIAGYLLLLFTLLFRRAGLRLCILQRGRKITIFLVILTVIDQCFHNHL